MKRTYMKKRCPAIVAGVTVLASSLMLSTPLIASDYSFSGESNTIVRMRTTIDKKDLYPIYEYLRFNMIDNRSDGSGVSFNVGAWGRADFADRTAAKDPDGDLQYAYLTYHAAKNNAVASIGRQLVNEGVASERIDGVSLRTDFDHGFGAAGFFGKTVMTEPNFEGGQLIYGVRLFQAHKKYYTVGLSALKSERDDNSRYREEAGVDVWLRPFQQLDLTGRSTYNSITDGWMENSYAVSFAPLTALRLGADFSHINFRDYLASVTTSALSVRGINPVWRMNEKQTAVGATAAFSVNKDLTVSGDFKFFSYDQSGESTYYGGTVAYLLPDAFRVGGAVHRMEGDTRDLRYLEFRAFASKKFGPVDLTIDAMNVNYDNGINGIRNSYEVTGAAGYEINRGLKVGADAQYSRNPYFDHEVRALVKATYTFDSKFAAEGRTKSEK